MRNNVCAFGGWRHVQRLRIQLHEPVQLFVFKTKNPSPKKGTSLFIAVPPLLTLILYLCPLRSIVNADVRCFLVGHVLAVRKKSSRVISNVPFYCCAYTDHSSLEK